MFRITLVALCLFLLHMTKATAPKPTTDGYCFKYIIQGYDTCSLIAKKHSITEADIESFNKDTWAWLGCDRLYQGDFICLSAGKPPMPMALPQATCGPQVPGTVRPAKWADLAGLNPCPSSKCCAFWGQCGVSELYCQNYRAPPAGPTATVKCATEAPKSLPSSTNKSEPDSKGSKDSNSKSDPKSKSDSKSTTKATTKAEPTTTKTKPTSTKTKKKWTPEPTVSQYPWKAPWEMTMYSELGCEGDYYHLEGYNKKFLDDEGCLAIHGGLNSKFTETGVTCKWWPDGSLTWKNCDAGTLKKPKSWVVKNGYCKVFSKADCDCSDNWSLFYLPEGCTNTTSKDHTPQWEALQCSIDGRKWP